MKTSLVIPVICLLTCWAAPKSSAQSEPALKDVFKNNFLVGAALNEQQFSNPGQDNREAALIKKHFNSITPENVLKWESVHPAPDKYNFGPGDRYVEFGVKNGMFIIGHNLIWHNQTPAWVFENDQGAPISREALLQRMRNHILTVVGRYKGKIAGWDVVNEAINEDGTLRQSSWCKIIGDDYLLKAYQFAHEADPSTQLYYNEYSMENPAKRAGALALVKKLRQQGAAITGVGIQGHYRLDWPAPKDLEDTIDAFAGLGLKVMITELDIGVLPPVTRSHTAEVSLKFALREKENPYTNGLPDSVQQALAARYAQLFKVFVKHKDQITRVTFWGVTDADSWLNSWPVRGRTDYPLLFGRDCEPKPAFYAITK